MPRKLPIKLPAKLPIVLAPIALLAAAGVAVAALATGPAVAAGDLTEDWPGTVAPEGTALRQAPDPESARLAAVAGEEEVPVLCVAEGAAQGAWYLVHAADHYAWASAREVALPEDAAPPWC
ncbi:SH3 domain-containing protein [Streptomyces sp. DSM 44917]|uniref:SH3 domain-containing protein n=1 Tax=Streptomyces boetiae TaxID=3075541 RepID=A0ABU2L9S8_9ACTN|nr:SH3 domain-containing protein [Streptomyces sp. DSM 44917]MDT0308326.1 SH3 domain-containing protein [Streptomyces sp. DSM 44917]